MHRNVLWVNALIFFCAGTACDSAAAICPQEHLVHREQLKTSKKILGPFSPWPNFAKRSPFVFIKSPTKIERLLQGWAMGLTYS